MGAWTSGPEFADSGSSQIATLSSPAELRELQRVMVGATTTCSIYKRLDPEALAILSALSRGVTVEDASVEAVNASVRTGIDWSAQIKEWFDNWATLGWFCRLT
jgi:hypothetical protein